MNKNETKTIISIVAIIVFLMALSASMITGILIGAVI
tara:strand:+ start:96 stop:206 length:111 start_codon:yes stop_codon:yes gene_type:complete